MGMPAEIRIHHGEARVRRTVLTINGGTERGEGTAALHRFRSPEPLPEREELFCFPSGAKLYRVSERVWVIRGYHPTNRDVQAAYRAYVLADEGEENPT